ncbi:MAG: phosphotransferase family protein, partial [Gammaproteobacteria bacterium]|nr:phosphotransferase family protein [Gammaproteobacteria bacterium]
EPRVVHVLEPGDGVGEGFIMEWLEGEALGARINRAPEFDAVRGKLAYQCGELLARIHGIDLVATGLDQRLGRLEPETFVRQKWEQYQLFETPQPMIDFAARWLLDHLPPEGELTLVHNDFRNGNLMVSPETGVTAVLDWEVAHIGDPMRDLGWICTNSWRFGSSLPVGGFGEYAELFAGYESVSGVKVDPARVKFWEVFGSYWWAIGCLGMAFAYRNGPDRTVERPGIGRRSSECQVDCVNLLIPGPVQLPAAAMGVSSTDTPRTDELLESVRDFLRGDVMSATEGRTNFMARVASNSLDIALREIALGPAHLRQEHARLTAMFGTEDDLDTLRWRLVRGLRDGSMALDHPGLAEHLRATVVGRIAIDQPKYSGLKTAINFTGGR